MTWEITLAILTIVLPVLSAVLVAVLNNWEKINPGKRKVNEVYALVAEMKQEMKDNNEKSDQKFEEMSDKIDTISSAQRTSLQTRILADCKVIQNAIDDGDRDYEEELKQLIILYREYWFCKYNSQGRIYFNSIIQRASEDNATLVHELMNLYFPEYDPDTH